MYTSKLLLILVPVLLLATSCYGLKVPCLSLHALVEMCPGAEHGPKQVAALLRPATIRSFSAPHCLQRPKERKSNGIAETTKLQSQSSNSEFRDTFLGGIFKDILPSQAEVRKAQVEMMRRREGRKTQTPARQNLNEEELENKASKYVPPEQVCTALIMIHLSQKTLWSAVSFAVNMSSRSFCKIA